MVEFKDLNVVTILLDLISNHLSTPVIVCQILSNFTNLALNDQISTKIRLHGAHIIGKIMMENCPILTKDKLEKDAGMVAAKYSDDQNEDIKIKHEI